VTIRKFTLRPFTPEDLVHLGAMTEPMMQFLGSSVRAKANILVSGGTGAGKTSLLGVLSSFIPPEERLVTIEDAAELRLSQPHVVSLESRPANAEGAGEVTVRQLVRNALRMRPDRIIVGEVRGGEALDMLQAMNTGHEGSLSTAHANSPRDLLSRLETMALMSDVQLPVSHLREQIAGALDLIVHLSRMPDGNRVVSKISAVEGVRAGGVILQDIFTWRRGPEAGFHATGAVPSMGRRLEERGERADPRIFAPRSGESVEATGARHPRLRRHRSVALRTGTWNRPWPGSIRRLGSVVE
jgi:pilus assembly protein CpaF